MAELRKTILGRFRAPSQASISGSLPIRRKPVAEPVSSTDEITQPGGYFSPRIPGEIATPELVHKAKFTGTTSKSEQNYAHLKPSVLERATQSIGKIHPHTRKTITPQPSQLKLSMNPRSGSAGGPAQPNGNARHTVIDLTSDSDDDDMYGTDDLPKRAKATGNRFAYASASPPRPAGQGMLDFFDAFETPAPNTPRQDGSFHADEAYARALQNAYTFDPASGQEPHVLGQPAPGAETAVPNAAVDHLVDCIQVLEMVFPGICTDHVSELFNTISKSLEQLIDHILSKGPYPRAKDRQIALKRKRELDPDEEAARQYGASDRVIPEGVHGVRPMIRTVLGSEFPSVSMAFIDSTLRSCGYRLFSAHRILSEALRTYSPTNKTYHQINRPRKPDPMSSEESVAAALASPGDDKPRIEVLTELKIARNIERREAQRHAAALKVQRDEEENTRQAMADGLMGECGCCCDEFPLNRLVHCNGEAPHSFCKTCARSNAETEVGKSKFELICMSVDGCKGGFSLEQRSLFLDENTRIALDRNEQEAALRLAGIENLESCPFCPFAAEYPPIEIDREFRCQAPDCEKVSCRLCREESHIPKTCEEHMREKGLSIRRQVEEAMSAALIRKCNKCGTPFVKEEGCNKMTCTRNGCGNMQCYVCSMSCDYKHFNDTARGGKPGNCPLFDSVDERHEGDVNKAEQDALQKIIAEHPEYTEDDLKVKMSDNVKKDDETRKKMPGRGAVIDRMNEMEALIAAREFRALMIRPPPQYLRPDVREFIFGNAMHPWAGPPLDHPAPPPQDPPIPGMDWVRVPMHRLDPPDNGAIDRQVPVLQIDPALLNPARREDQDHVQQLLDQRRPALAAQHGLTANKSPNVVANPTLQEIRFQLEQEDLVLQLLDQGRLAVAPQPGLAAQEGLGAQREPQEQWGQDFFERERHRQEAIIQEQQRVLAKQRQSRLDKAVGQNLRQAARRITELEKVPLGALRHQEQEALMEAMFQAGPVGALKLRREAAVPPPTPQQAALAAQGVVTRARHQSNLDRAKYWKVLQPNLTEDPNKPAPSAPQANLQGNPLKAKSKRKAQDAQFQRQRFDPELSFHQQRPPGHGVAGESPGALQRRVTFLDPSPRPATPTRTPRRERTAAQERIPAQERTPVRERLRRIFGQPTQIARPNPPAPLQEVDYGKLNEVFSDPEAHDDDGDNL